MNRQNTTSIHAELMSGRLRPMTYVTTHKLSRILDEAHKTETVIVIRPPTKHYIQALMEVQASTYAPWPGDLVRFRDTQYRVVTDP
jgi:hypothetical protein